MKIRLVYKSKSGFTKRYAEWIAQETGCQPVPLQAARGAGPCDVLVYGSRLCAGRLEGLSRARKLFAGSGAGHFIVFATGAMPASAAGAVAEMWRNNLTASELETVPYFYLQAGICYERMGRADKAMMKVGAFLMEKQGNSQAAQAMRSSYDISDRRYIAPLTELLNSLQKGAR